MKKQFNVTQILPISVLAIALVTGLILKLEIDNKNDIKTLVSNQQAQNAYVQCQFRHLDSPKIVKAVNFDFGPTVVPNTEYFVALARKGAMGAFEISRAHSAEIHLNQVIQSLISTQTNFDFSACDQNLLQTTLTVEGLSGGGLSEYLK
jgi:hypothetical protein